MWQLLVREKKDLVELISSLEPKKKKSHHKITVAKNTLEMNQDLLDASLWGRQPRVFCFGRV